MGSVNGMPSSMMSRHVNWLVIGDLNKHLLGLRTCATCFHS